MDEQIKALNLRVDSLMTRMNVVLVFSAIGFLITCVKLAMSVSQPHSAPAPTNTNSVQIGNADEKKPQREFLNSDEVGEREGVSSRTVTSWIEQGRIYPQPTRQGRAWIIAADYRLLPITTELTETKP